VSREILDAGGAAHDLVLEIRQMNLADGRGRELESRFQFGENNGHEETNNSKRI
jgi:hypothetical protein